MRAPLPPLRPVDGPASVDDAALLAAVAAGDEGAFRALHLRHHDALHGFALRLTGSLEDAEEVVGDAMLAVWRGAAKFEGRAKVRTWIFGIAYRLVRSRRRRLWRLPRRVAMDDAPEPVDPTPDAVETMFDRRAVRRAMGKLPLELRAVVELTFYAGLSYPEIAEALDCPVGTIKSRMHAARAKLRKTLG